jgi:hypothetical protein
MITIVRIWHPDISIAIIAQYLMPQYRNSILWNLHLSFHLNRIVLVLLSKDIVTCKVSIRSFDHDSSGCLSHLTKWISGNALFALIIPRHNVSYSLWID